MLNRCDFIGNLGADPEIRHTQAGDKVVSFRLAVSEKWKDRNGERQERTTWVPVVIWNEKLGEVAERYLSKGSRCFVSGAFVTRKWTDQSGQEKYSTEIVLQRFRGELVLLGGRDEGGQAPERDYSERRKAERGIADDLDEDLPF